MGADPQYAKWPLLPLAQHVFTLTNPYAARPAQQASVKSLQDAINEHKMAPLYKYLAHPTEGILNAVGESTSSTSTSQKSLTRKSSALGMVASKSPSPGANLPWDDAVYQNLKADNDKELEDIQKEEDEAVEKAGDTEIMGARGKRAEFYARIGDKVCEACVKVGVLLTHITGQGDSSLRGCLREDRHSRYEDRSCPRYDPDRSILWRQGLREEGSCQSEDLGGERR